MPDGLTKEEINRKLLHGLAVILPVSMFYWPVLLESSRAIFSLILLLLFTISLVVEFARLKNNQFSRLFFTLFGSMLRKEESRQLTGATYVLAGSVFCSLISLSSDSAAAASFLGLTLFILGDAVAALVGKGIGRIKVGHKTIEGAVGCFLFCILLTTFVFPELPGFLADWGGDLTGIQIIAISASVSILEFFPIKSRSFVLNDNLYVPALASLIALALSEF